MFGIALPENFWVGVSGSVVFGLLGILFLLFGFKLFDWILPKVDFQESMKSNPLAAAIVVGSFFLALAHIISSVVH